MMKKNKKTMWFKGPLWGYIEQGELTLSTESKLYLAKENNRRLMIDELRRLMNAPATV